MENLTCYSLMDLLDCMNLLLSNLETIQFGDESYPTQSILGSPSHSLKDFHHDKNEYIKANLDQNRPSIANQSDTCLFTPKNARAYLNESSDLPQAVREPSGHSEIENLQSKVSIYSLTA